MLQKLHILFEEGKIGKFHPKVVGGNLYNNQKNLIFVLQYYNFGQLSVVQIYVLKVQVPGDLEHHFLKASRRIHQAEWNQIEPKNAKNLK